jgi:hypothetical protein
VPTLNQNTTGTAATVTTNANLTGDVTSIGNTATVVKINGTSLAGLSTGLLKNTTTTGMPSIALAGADYQAPLTLTTTGTGAATLSGTTLNIPTPTSSSGTAHYVGEYFGGGIVYYITAGGYHGLIVETYESGNATNEDALDIVSNPTYHNSTYNGNLFTDWRVPTYYELLLLYNARSTPGLNLTTGTYISCSVNAYSQYRNLKFSDKSLQLENANWTPRSLRAIRSF